MPKAPNSATIEATDIESFFRLVETLPEYDPEKPARRCNMFKQKFGRRWRPICKGTCQRGTCGIVVTVGRRNIEAHCECS